MLYLQGGGGGGGEPQEISQFKSFFEEICFEFFLKLFYSWY